MEPPKDFKDSAKIKPSKPGSPLELFLSGRGPNPIPPDRRQSSGPLAKQFIAEAMDDIAQQDRDRAVRPKKSTPRKPD